MEGGCRLPNVIDLFAGAGGLSLGAARAGFNISAAVEVDTHAMDSHRANFPHAVHIQRDIMTLNGQELLRLAGIHQEELTGIIGGPPCQGFSSIGHGNVNDFRNRLFVKFFELIEDLQPTFFLAENVPGIMNSKYDDIRNEAFGHVANYNILDPICVKANEYGAPTTRMRYFFVGYLLNGRIEPIISKDIIRMQVCNNERTNVRKALEGLPGDIRYRKKNSSGLKKLTQNYSNANAQHEQSDFFYQRVTGMIPYNVGNQEYINTYQIRHIVNGFYPTKHATDVRARYARLAFGQQDRVSKSTRLDPEGYCPTLRAGTGPEKGSYQAVRPIHYNYARVITPREAARLQGFPDWYKLPNTIWHGFRQIGNSVSPIVAEQVLSAIYQKLML
jgi:DNA (cytosine-5)-methyltransferase 1